MKVFAVLLLATAVVGVEIEDENVFKTWTKIKAHEACWGEENTKKYTVQLKRAVAKCTQQDAPELELPIYRSPYRVVNALLNNANQHERYVVNLLENIVDNLNTNQRHNNNNQQYYERRHDQVNNQNRNRQNYNNQHDRYNNQYNNQQYRPMTYRQAMTYRQDDYPQQYTQEYEEKTINRLASDVLRKVYEKEQQYKNYQDSYRNDVFDRRDDNYKNDDYKLPKRFNVEQARYKRESVPVTARDNNVVLPNVLDLGDRLRDKILDAEKHTQERIGNVTCIMKELKVINDNNQIDIAAIKNDLQQYQLSDWFKKRIENDYDNCYAVSQNVPASARNAFVYPGNPHLTKLKAFMSCCKEAKLQSCVYQDVRVKLEKNFGPLQKLLDTTGLTEQQIFPLVLQLLHGNEMEYFE